MAEYIEREAAVKAAKHAYNQWNLAMAAADGAREINLVYKRQELCKAVESVFIDAPAADVAPVVRGRWILNKKYAKCTCCGLTRDIESQFGWNYCPKCGAKMDLEE